VMTFAERLAQDRRLVILRLLQSVPGYEANESVVAMAVRDFGHACSRDTIRTDFAWLAEQGLLTIEEIATVQIATLTNRGFETAQGIVVTPGVARPSPGR
jgi:hypothetical protein